MEKEQAKSEKASKRDAEKGSKSKQVRSPASSSSSGTWSTDLYMSRYFEALDRVWCRLSTLSFKFISLMRDAWLVSRDKSSALLSSNNSTVQKFVYLFRTMSEAADRSRKPIVDGGEAKGDAKSDVKSDAKADVKGAAKIPVDMSKVPRERGGMI